MRTFFQGITHFYRNLRLQTKLTITHLVIVTIPMVAIPVLFFTQLFFQEFLSTAASIQATW